MKATLSILRKIIFPGIALRLFALPVIFAPLAALTQTITNLRKYTTVDGLSGNQVTSLLQDERGLLWVGTTKGLNWFDGTQFYQPPIRPRTGELFVSNIKEDREGNVWLTTYYNGIYKYHDNRFENFLPDTAFIESINNNAFDLLEYRRGIYLVATTQHLYQFREGRFVIFDTVLDQLNIPIGKLVLLDKDNLLALPASGKGIYWYAFRSDGSFQFRKLLEKRVVHDVAVDGAVIGIESDSGSTRFRSINDLRVDRPMSVSNATGGSGNIVYKDARGHPIADVNAVLADISQNTWLATHDGLIKLNRNNYTLIPLKEAGVPSTVISAVEDGDRRLWCGSFDGLIRRDERGWRFLREVDGRRVGFVYALRKDAAGSVWAATDAGLLRLDGERPKRMATCIITSISEDAGHVLWCADMKGAIYQLRDGKLTATAISPRLDDMVAAVYRDEYGFLWVGFFTRGLVKYEWRMDHWQALQEFSAKTGYENCRIRCLCSDRHGHLLAGTRTRGYLVFPLKQRTYEAVSDVTREKNGLSDNWVKRIIAGETGKLLLANGHGIDILSGDPANPSITKMSFSDGENILEPYSLDRADTGYLVGSTNALIHFDAGSGTYPHPMTKVFFTKVTINGQADSLFVPYAAVRDKLHLNYHQNNLSFEFCGVGFFDENNTHYKYMLEGIDTSWGSPVSGTSLNFSSLPPGDYVLKIVAQNDAGIWGNDPASFAFIISTPFWKQGWFVAAAALFFASVVYLAYRYRLLQLLAVERLRTKIATDLHDDIGSTLSSIGILSNMALKEKISGETKGMMEEINTNSALLMERMDDIVWSINPRNDTLEDLLCRIKNFATKLFEAKGIDFEIQIGETAGQVRLPMLVRQHIYMILKEAINNLVKYSFCTRAAIEIRADDKVLYARVCDNGVGFDPSVTPAGNGLLNMRNRAAGMNANIMIESDPGMGAVICLWVKIK